MEKKNERVLAYQKSKLIEDTVLSDVSGGFTMCHTKTAQATGSRDAWDACIDIRIDA